jgi:hypothetical protein
MWIRCAIVAAILSLARGPAGASHRRDEVGHRLRRPGSGTGGGSPRGRESRSPHVGALLAQHNFPSSKFSTYPVRQPVRMVALHEIDGNFLHSVDTIDVVGVNDRAEDFRGR